MKRIYKELKLLKRILIVSLAFFYIPLFAQTSHQVEASNYKFNPSELTINAGDTVVWKNIEGTHNVDGKTSTFPDNPQSFGNDVGSGWTYSFVFTIGGTYNYQCDPHASLGMTGIITVNGGSASSDNQTFASTTNFILYPNPVSTDLHIRLPQELNNENLSISIFDITGKEILRYNYVESSEQEITINTTELSDGLYIIKFQSGDFEKTKRFFKN